MDRPTRNPIKQIFYPLAVTVLTTPTPLNTNFQQALLSGFYDAFAISVPTNQPGGGATVGPVLLGDRSVDITVGNGLELPIGVGPIMFSIDNQRQIYELQMPLSEMACKAPFIVPFKCWDPSDIFLVDAQEEIVCVTLYPNPYV